MENKNLNNLSFAELQEEVKKLEQQKKTVVSKEAGWEIGENYLIRTVTHIQVGKLEDINNKEIILSNASWIADTGRFHKMLKNGLENVENSEIEPFIDDIIVNRGALIEATKYSHSLPNSIKE